MKQNNSLMIKLFNFYILAAAMLLTSCSDMLETDSSRQVFDPNLGEKTDSVYYALGVMQAMQELADHYVFQGEMRGDLTKVTEYTDNNLRQLANFTATTANKYDSAYVFYRVINNCNYYIAHRDTTLNTGANYVVMGEYIGIKAIRAWAYMQLARVYGKVPFYTQPLTQISDIDSNNFPELDLTGIVAALAPDLEQYSGGQFTMPNGEKGEYTLPDYGGSTPTNSSFLAENIFIPVDVILGDMYLETGQYDMAAKHYVTYITEVSENPFMAYTQEYKGHRYGSGYIMSADDMPSDWGDDDMTGNSGSWQDIFTNSNVDLVSYIPLNQNSRQGAITQLPLAFGYDYYSNNSGYVEEVQVLPSDSYVTLSESQDYYYNALTTGSEPVINSAKLGDNRLTAIQTSRLQGDSTKIWTTKYRYPRVILYRNTTVWLHLAEAFNRLGMYDAAFAILKEGINACTQYAQYMTPASMNALQTTYPLLSEANLSKLSYTSAFFGAHSHGSGVTRDTRLSRTSASTYQAVYYPGLSPYQLQPVVGKKMEEIANQFSEVTVGTTPQDTINAVEDLLCDEYALEFAFEGSRFYDLCRLARHKNNAALYGSDFGSKWLAKKLAFKATGLEDKSKWYLPLQ